MREEEKPPDGGSPKSQEVEAAELALQKHLQSYEARLRCLGNAEESTEDSNYMSSYVLTDRDAWSLPSKLDGRFLDDVLPYIEAGEKAHNGNGFLPSLLRVRFLISKRLTVSLCPLQNPAAWEDAERRIHALIIRSGEQHSNGNGNGHGVGNGNGHAIPSSEASEGH